MTLKGKQALFVAEYLVDLNATQAAIRAGYSAKTAEWIGPRLVTKSHVAAAIQAAMAKRSKNIEITADMVLRKFWSIATANPNELIEYRRTCCRHCWGSDHRRQHTVDEMRERRGAFDKHRDGAHAEAWDADGLFDEAGGIGYDATRPPHPECPECFGQGVGDAFVHDTRRLSPDAQRLYAGVKVTKDGFQVLMHDQVNALIQVGRHLGMFKDGVDLTTGGKPLTLADFYGRLAADPEPKPS